MMHAARKDPRLVVRVTTALFPLAVLLTGCGSSETEEPAPEATEFSDPATETGEPQEEQQQTAPAAVAVELPGLPIGGPSPAFTAPGDTQCTVINLSGNPLPSGVVAVIEGFVPIPSFSFAAGSCGGVPACLEGGGITPEGGTCSLSVTYDLDPATSGTTLEVPVEVPLEVAAATLQCPDVPTCETAQQTVLDSGLETVELEVFWVPTAPEDSPESPLEGTGEGEGSDTAPDGDD